MENEKQTNEEKEIVFKCASCGANLTQNSKKCEYCGSINPNFKSKELKPNKQLLNKSKNMFGGIFGNVFEEILNNFDEE